ncbi:MAG: MCE family protein [Candidatus Cloacimonetes bacterium]|nr:MCE family protein [Candidatus Cloacimonadota bacterium]
MVSKAQKFRLGVFIVVISAFMIFFIIMVAGRQLMEKRDTYQIIYKDLSVSGLQVGGAVKYHGINVGRIDDIIIDREDITNVIVKISLKGGTPIKADVIASLTPVGITGLLQVELSGGSNEADILPPGSTIKAGTSVFESISGKAEIISEKLEAVLNNLTQITNQENQAKIAGILNNVDSVLETNRESFNNIVTSMDSTSYYLAQLTRSSSEALARINEILQSEQFENILDNSEKFTRDLAQVDMAKLLANLNNAIRQIDETFAHIDMTHLRSRQDIVQTIEFLRETVDYLNEFSRQISEEPSILLRSKRK